MIGATIAATATALCVLLLGVAFRPRPTARRPVPSGRVTGGTNRSPGRRVAASSLSSGSPGSPVVVGAVALVAVASLAALGGVVIALVVAAMAGWWLGTAGRRGARHRRRAIAAAMPEALDLLIVTIEAGYLPVEAMRVLHPVLWPVVGDAFADVVARVDRGERVGDALRALPDRLGPPSLTLVDSLLQTDRAGLAFGPAIARLADDARDHRRRLAEAAARELPVRLSFPLVLCTLPSFALVAIVPLLVGALSSVQVR